MVDVNKVLASRLTPGFWADVAVEWHRLYTPYVPMDTGRLASDVTIDSAGGRITHGAPYASRLYNGQGMNFNRDKHPLASARWDQAAAPSELGKLAAYATGRLNG